MNDDLTKFIKLISKGSIKYADPRELDPKLVDTKIRKAVTNINRSNFIWTLWSCQGHNGKNDEFTLPYITFIVKNDKINLFLKQIFKTLPYYNSKKFPVSPNYHFSINRGFSNNKFSIVSIHWSKNYLNKNKKFSLYSDLLFISKKIKDSK